MPDMSLDEDLIVIEHLDFDIECVYGDKKATWLAIVLCCKNEVILCDEHRQRELSDFKRAPRRSCISCGYTWNASTEINIDWIKL